MSPKSPPPAPAAARWACALLVAGALWPAEAKASAAGGRLGPVLEELLALWNFLRRIQLCTSCNARVTHV
eukprot:CAMPEP_0182856900 /NCGR_PEP_ID=MMETSP0034_2-20130328/2728_1 /TAXON_ID=156128 /ORGANISM="Nephroselmis pyriformis, Strain CCMP717" /LENGTH=69 /DNA_ID=CAMNT_0024988065 /DNA_START=16 /DNA_END=225 /DNA_ORIENTATION=-